MLLVNCIYILLWLITVAQSKFSAHEKKGLMKIQMEMIKANLGTFTSSLSNTIPQTCSHGRDDISAVVNINQRRIQLESMYDQSTWQDLGAAMRVLKNSFLNMSARQNRSCTGPEPVSITTQPVFWNTSAEVITTMISSAPVTVCSGHVCGDGECIPSYWVCDGQEDCKDCSDEKNCTKADRPTSCPPHMYRCSKMGTCIDRDWLCDGKPDCKDGEDEENCAASAKTITTYGPDDIICGNGSHVPIYFNCDGDTDCDDCRDERYCVQCPGQFTAVGHLCLQIDVKKRTWEEASQNCQRLGGHLAEPRDMDALKCFMQEERGMRARYWVGGSDISGRWTWSGGAVVPRRLLPSGAKRSSSRYIQPQTASDDKLCLEIMPRKTSTPFNTSNCKMKFRSLCQIDNIP